MFIRVTQRTHGFLINNEHVVVGPGQVKEVPDDFPKTFPAFELLRKAGEIVVVEPERVVTPTQESQQEQDAAKAAKALADEASKAKK